MHDHSIFEGKPGIPEENLSVIMQGLGACALALFTLCPYGFLHWGYHVLVSVTVVVAQLRVCMFQNPLKLSLCLKMLLPNLRMNMVLVEMSPTLVS